MNNSASTSSRQASPPEVPVVNRANKLSRDPLRRALVEALSRSPQVSDPEEVDSDAP